MWTKIKKVLAKFGAYILREFGADVLVTMQDAAYAKGKKSRAYKQIMAASSGLGKIAKMIGDVGQDGVFTEEEKEAAKAVWDETLEHLAALLDEVGK